MQMFGCPIGIWTRERERTHISLSLSPCKLIHLLSVCVRNENENLRDVTSLDLDSSAWTVKLLCYNSKPMWSDTKLDVQSCCHTVGGFYNIEYLIKIHKRKYLWKYGDVRIKFAVCWYFLSGNILSQCEFIRYH